MSKTAIYFTCAHSDPQASNERFSLLGELIYDVRPDIVVDLGDGADMRSLNTYDTRSPSKLVARSYERDIEVYNDAQERILHRIRKNKVKRPKRIGFEGNHENRIKKAIGIDPRLEGTHHGISFSHLNTNKWFDEYHEYKDGAPAIEEVEGVLSAHFVSSGNYGTAMSGEHHGYNLLKKKLQSTTVGHSHKRNIYFRDDCNAIGLVAGCFKGMKEDWAGQANDDWWSGVVIKEKLEDGYYEPRFVSLEMLEQEYGSDTRP